jgi:pilus assembly protein Flp/PilA
MERSGLSESTESQMKKLLVRFVKDELGVTAIEYGLIAGLISVVILVTVTAIGTALEGLFQTIATALAGA